MRIFDPKFFASWRRYVYQCSFVVVAMAVILTALDSVYQTVLIAALGASSVVAFSAPSLRASRPRCMVGGYVVGICVGAAMSLVAAYLADATPWEDDLVEILMGAIAVGLAMFIMVTTDTEHPPGAALALGFVLNEWDVMTVGVVLAGICSLSFIKEAVRSRLIDLL